MSEAEVFHRQVCRSTTDLFTLSPGFETRSRRDCALALSGERVADLNMAALGGDPQEAEAFLRASLDRASILDLPLIAVLAPGVAEDLIPTAEALGASFAAHMPLMAFTGPTPSMTPTTLDIRRAEEPADARLAFSLISDAFSLPLDAVARSMGEGTAREPLVDVYVGCHAGEPVTSVTLSQRGPFVGVWSMATPKAHQGRGYGRALLSRLIHQRREAGAEAFFLIATNAGRPLYRSLGFRTLFDYAICVTGESTQTH